MSCLKKTATSLSQKHYLLWLNRYSTYIYIHVRTTNLKAKYRDCVKPSSQYDARLFMRLRCVGLRLYSILWTCSNQRTQHNANERKDRPKFYPNVCRVVFLQSNKSLKSHDKMERGESARMTKGLLSVFMNCPVSGRRLQRVIGMLTWKKMPESQ